MGETVRLNVYDLLDVNKVRVSSLLASTSARLRRVRGGKAGTVGCRQI